MKKLTWIFLIALSSQSFARSHRPVYNCKEMDAAAVGLAKINGADEAERAVRLDVEPQAAAAGITFDLDYNATAAPTEEGGEPRMIGHIHVSALIKRGTEKCLIETLAFTDPTPEENAGCRAGLAKPNPAFPKGTPCVCTGGSWICPK